MLIIHIVRQLIELFLCFNFRFKTKPQMKNHRKHHDDVRPFPCTVCGRLFRRQYTLNVHMRSHTNTCPYTCRYCGKSFRHNVTLHVKSTIFTVSFLNSFSFNKSFVLSDTRTSAHQSKAPRMHDLPLSIYLQRKSQ